MILKFMLDFLLANWTRLFRAVTLSFLVTGLNIVSLALFAALSAIVLGSVGTSAGGGASGLALPDLPIEFLNSGLRTIGGYVDGLDVLSKVLVISGIYLAIILFCRWVELLAFKILIELKKRSTCGFLDKLFRHAMSLPLESIQRRGVGDLSSRLTADAQVIAGTSLDIFYSLIIALPLFAFYWTILISSSPQLTLILVITVMLKSAVSHHYGKKSASLVKKSGKIGAKASAKLVEVINGIALVKAYCTEEREIRAYKDVVDRQTNLRENKDLLLHKNSSFQNVLQSVSVVTVVTTGILLALAENITFGLLVVYFFTANRAQESTRQMISFFFLAQRVFAHIDRVRDLLNERQTLQDGDKEIAAFKRELTFNQISFSYPGGKGGVDGIGLSIEKGETIAIVGASGSGKSTLISLLLRLYDPSSGSVSIDGEDIRNFTQLSYRSLFGIVTQDPIIFSGTVRDNIAYGAKGAVSDEEVVAAAKLAHVHEFVSEWPDGYATQVGERGTKLSGGQRQRIALARAILRNPEIVVLDEATSSLDGRAEHEILKASKTFLSERTVIIVAHRLTTIQDVGKIFVLAKGRVVETGNHEQLMRIGGEYHALFAKQAQSRVQ